jgi:hypothetical protein
VCGAEGQLTHFDGAAGGLSCERCGSGTFVGAAVIDELRLLVVRSPREAIANPPHELGLHWRLLAHYVSYHVSELNSLSALLVSRPDTPALTRSPLATAG